MQPQVGDFILCERRGFIARCIRLGQSIRFRGPDRKYARFTHAALVVSRDGALVEATSKGVERSHLTKFKDVPYVMVHTYTGHEDQGQILRFANRVVGEEYGYATIACCVLGLLTGGAFTFGFQGQSICSGLVARAQERSGAYFDRLAEDIMPADLARYYKVVA
jgi:uncharacterized protein YycO